MMHTMHRVIALFSEEVKKQHGVGYYKRMPERNVCCVTKYNHNHAFVNRIRRRMCIHIYIILFLRGEFDSKGVWPHFSIRYFSWWNYWFLIYRFRALRSRIGLNVICTWHASMRLVDMDFLLNVKIRFWRVVWCEYISHEYVHNILRTYNITTKCKYYLIISSYYIVNKYNVEKNLKYRDSSVLNARNRLRQHPKTHMLFVGEHHQNPLISIAYLRATTCKSTPQDC